MFIRSDDPVADWDSYCAEQEELLKKAPICSECDQHIPDEYAYYINGEWICCECMSQYRREIIIDD